MSDADATQTSETSTPDAPPADSSQGTPPASDAAPPSAQAPAPTTDAPPAPPEEAPKAPDAAPEDAQPSPEPEAIASTLPPPGGEYHLLRRNGVDFVDKDGEWVELPDGAREELVDAAKHGVPLASVLASLARRSDR